MARLSITVAHGTAADAAKEHFRSTIQDVRKRYLGWINGVDWTEDGHSATVVGPGFEVRCWCDDRDLHIEGTIPLAWKLLENAFRNRIKQDIERVLATHEA
jgi:hypothetical protein